MKNLPYYKGGTCEKTQYHISFNGDLKDLQFDTFEDFCQRADEILYTFMKHEKEIDLVSYKKYIYDHDFCENDTLNNAIKDKCYEWILSYKYDEMKKNVLYAMLGLLKKENKWNTNLKK